MCFPIEFLRNWPMQTPCPVLDLLGNGYSRGQTHGSSLKNLIHQNINNWKQYIERRHSVPVSRFVADFLSRTSYVQAVSTYCPDLLDEVRGIADGCGIDFETVFAYQLLPEEWVFETGEVNTLERDGGGCSVVAIKRSGTETLLAQNMDINRFYDGGQVILNVKGDDGVQSYILTIAGFIGLCGMNNYAVGQCCNTMSQVKTDDQGVPVTFFVRIILGCKSVADVKDRLNSVPHASGMNYTVCSATEWTSLECSANRVSECFDSKNSDFKVFCHTNHPLVSDDLKCENPPVSVSSKNRFEFLTEKLNTDVKEISEDEIKSWLSQHPVCIFEEHNTGFTFGSLVMRLSPATGPVLYVSPGPPSITKWATLTFSVGCC